MLAEFVSLRPWNRILPLFPPGALFVFSRMSTEPRGRIDAHGRLCKAEREHRERDVVPPLSDRRRPASTFGSFHIGVRVPPHSVPSHGQVPGMVCLLGRETAGPDTHLTKVGTCHLTCFVDGSCDERVLERCSPSAVRRFRREAIRFPHRRDTRQYLTVLTLYLAHRALRECESSQTAQAVLRTELQSFHRRERAHQWKRLSELFEQIRDSVGLAEEPLLTDHRPA